MPEILIFDPSLRDGNHAIKHQLTENNIVEYVTAAEAAGIPIVEIGHGNGLGASSLQIGKSLLTDAQMLSLAREKLSNTKLAVFCIPGFSTINKDLKKAIDLGVDIFRVGTHCTEADISQKHFEFVRSQNKTAYGSLMMTHMASKEILLQECKKMSDYGAQGIILMDSAGSYLPKDVSAKISFLTRQLEIPVGFHAHNNLGLALANSLAAVEAGAKIIDGTIRGFGAGAGNTALELLIPVLEKLGYRTNISLYKILDLAEWAEKELLQSLPFPRSENIISGLSGLFSSFAKQVEKTAKEYRLNSRDIMFELGKRKVIAGQENLITEVAIQMSKMKELKSLADNTKFV